MGNYQKSEYFKLQLKSELECKIQTWAENTTNSLGHLAKPKRQEPVCSHERIKDAAVVPKTKLYMNLNKQNYPNKQNAPPKPIT